MNSLKSSITVLFLLFVSYGVYRVIHTPDPIGATSGQFLVGDAKPGEAKIPTAASPLVPPPLTAATPAAPPALPAAGLSPADALAQGPLDLIKPNAPAPVPLPPRPEGVSPPPTASDTAGGLTGSPPLPPVPTANQNSLIATQAMTGGAAIARTSGLEANGAGSEASPPPATVPATGPGNGSTLPTKLPASSGLLPAAVDSPAAGTGALAPAAAPPVAWDGARLAAADLVRQGQMVQALRQLSQLYRSPLEPAQRTELLSWLDALASRVVYSTENCFSPAPYIVQPGETLESVAAQWKVPPQLVANVNRAKLPANGTFVAGLELKSIPGPFRGEISVSQRELTLFLGDMYAGRFSITPPGDATLPPGQFQVGPPQRDEATGQVIFLEIGQGITLAGAANALPNSIVLSDRDAQDVFGILSADSEVTILR